MSDHPLLASLNSFVAEHAIAVVGEQSIDYGYQLKLERGGERVTVNLYTTGKLLIQGKPGPLKQLLETWQREAPLAAQAPPRDAQTGDGAGVGLLAPLPHIGLDESGKGDYFGPLVVAAVAVDTATAPRLAAIGVRDSKQLGDAAITRLAASVRATCPHARVVLLPERYNQLYIKFGSNLNRMLAWAHARALEDVLEQAPVELAVADQFADPQRLQAALQERGRMIALVQQPRAEADIAVAAASLLARAEFVAVLSRLGRGAGVVLPAGASDIESIMRAGQQILAVGGEAALARYAKLHFKTTARLLGR